MTYVLVVFVLLAGGERNDRATLVPNEKACEQTASDLRDLLEHNDDVKEAFIVCAPLTGQTPL